MMMRRVFEQSRRVPQWIVDAGVAVAFAALIAAALGIDFLNSANLPTGGDTASHILYAKLYADELLWSGQVTAWVPEVFAGLPFLSYYFPLPFIVIAVLSKLIGFAAAFKWGSFLACMALPGAVSAASRRWLGFSWPAALLAGIAALAYLFHEQNSIWGGNLLSTLAGEFAYSYGILFAVLAIMAWSRAATLGHGWILAALLEAASGFSHGFPLLIVGTSTAFLLLDAGPARWRSVFFLLLRGHLLAFCLLGGWLWPLLEMHRLTIPNDASFPITGWRDLLPSALWPVLACGVIGAAALALPSVRAAWSSKQAQAARYLAAAAGLSALAFMGGDRLGLADIRFFPLVWLLGGIVCAWLFGQALNSIKATSASWLVTVSLLMGMLGWIGSRVNTIPDWGLWNHSGLEAKPQWQVLSRLFPAMRGDLWSPRLVFEHDPDNNDIGSTRALEALPLFLNHRPVLEGLYMESALMGPAIYQLQSEVSARPSSPLVRFPSGSLDPDFAARHMNALHTDGLLLRSAKAKAAIEASGLFVPVATSPPFALYRLRNFDSKLVQVLGQPVNWRPKDDWMQDAFAWFKTRSRFDAYQPVYGAPVTIKEGPPPSGTAVAVKALTRQEMVFETEAVGYPHLIKIAYHPRWELASRGSLRIAAPGFMLVVPEEKEIRLVYGHTLVGKIGMAATSGVALLLCWIAYRRLRRTKAHAEAVAPHERWRAWPVLLTWSMLIGIGTYVAIRSPERVYSRGWEAMRAGRHLDASADFAQAYAMRRPLAKREEALFWWAKSSELAGKFDEAVERYKLLADGYHGYWVPESIHQLVILKRRNGHAADVEPYIARMREEYPGNRWTLQLTQNEKK